jgi:hypothetical protein
MSNVTLREAIIEQFGHVYDETGRAYRTAYPWVNYTDPKAFAECIANAVYPEIATSPSIAVKTRHDPTTALPANPVIGDVYLSTATANGWTKDRLYTWSGMGKYHPFLPETNGSILVLLAVR